MITPIPTPTCDHGPCDDAPEVQWSRRPTEAELAALVSVEMTRRRQILALADPRQPPAFGPLPTADTTVVAVRACRDHAIDLEAATRVHAADCGASHPDHLPGCNCTPEAAVLDALVPSTVTTVTGWQFPA